MPCEAIQYEDNIPALHYGGNVDALVLNCSLCEVEYHVHYSNSEATRLADNRYLAKKRITAQHPDHERSILL